MTERSLLYPQLQLDPEFEHLRSIIHLVGDGYPAINHEGKSVKLARFIVGCDELMWVDHIDHDIWNHKKLNLRACTPQENNFNRRKTSNKKSSKYKGVCYRASKDHWRTQIMVDGTSYYLGTYKKEEDAARAYNAAALKYFGKFAVLNEIPNA